MSARSLFVPNRILCDSARILSSERSPLVGIDVYVDQRAWIDAGRALVCLRMELHGGVGSST